MSCKKVPKITSKMRYYLLPVYYIKGYTVLFNRKGI